MTTSGLRLGLGDLFAAGGRALSRYTGTLFAVFVAQSLLAAILQAQGQIPEAIVAFRESLAVQPHPLRHSKLLLALQYAEGVTPQALLAEHRAWEASYSASWRDVLSPPANPASNNRPLRIGFVSPPGPSGCILAGASAFPPPFLHVLPRSLFGR